MDDIEQCLQDFDLSVSQQVLCLEEYDRYGLTEMLEMADRFDQLARKIRNESTGMKRYPSNFQKGNYAEGTTQKYSLPINYVPK